MVLLIISAIWITLRELSNPDYCEKHVEEVLGFFCRKRPVDHPFLLGKRKETLGVLSLVGLLEQSISVRVIILLRLYNTKLQ